MLNKKETSRYLRQMILPEISTKGQLKLKNAKVLIAGAGGLGSPAAYYLAAAGVGHIVIIDSDTVELSNLNRQILHATSDIDRPKALSAKESLQALNPEITVDYFHDKLDAKSIIKYAEGVQIMVDCFDNIKSRLEMNAYCVKNNVAIMHAGIDSWYGQITLIIPGKTPCLQCLFENYTEPQGPKPVLGVVAGAIGCMQALETIKFLLGKSTLNNQLYYFDALNADWTKIPINKNTECSVCKS